MFKSFFANRRWLHWSLLGGGVILGMTWYKVQLDVRINEWFGDFYDTLQRALGEQGSISFESFLAILLTFVKITLIYSVVAALLEFLIRHFVFRWRMAMNDYYMSSWNSLRHIEGAAQRVQEDTMRFAKHCGKFRGYVYAIFHDLAGLPSPFVDFECQYNGDSFIGEGGSLPRLFILGFYSYGHNPFGLGGNKVARFGV